jgi:UDP-N-acetylmuramate dehydrogenase
MLGRLPAVRGKYTANAPLHNKVWFGVGGTADVLFEPQDVSDLQHFLRHTPHDIPLFALGLGSNLLVREGGIKGVVIRLGKAFQAITVENEILTAGAAALDKVVAQTAFKHSLTGLEFLSGIPGTIGGAVKMNAGCYGSETKDTLLTVDVVHPDGSLETLTNKACGFSYRHSALADDTIIVSASFQLTHDDNDAIAERLQKIKVEREAAQPSKVRTGGSTFKNPAGHKAWELIDAAGCRGLTRGDAQISEKHCNFLLNLGNATAKDIEMLGEDVRTRVKEQTGVALEWEINRIGVRNAER